jgi:L-erythro-3,5-diaminohexanoate dehydrogenase
MKIRASRVEETALEVGADRVVSPRGFLPQPAEVLDASGPVRPHELEITVDRLCLDSTSHRQIAESAGGDAEAMAARVAEIVSARGKMHNPATDSGGILTGTVSAVGDDFPDPPQIGTSVATLASLTLTPLRLSAITELDPTSAQIGVNGTAYVCARAAWAEMPHDLTAEKALEVFDVCAAASHTRDLAPIGGSVCVLGAGHAGKLALAAARDSSPDSTLTVVDVDAGAVARSCELGLADIGVAADLRDPLGALEAAREAGAPPADLTVVVVNATGCEAAAILMTSPAGRILFFSMATSFGTAALTSDGLSSESRMVIGSGFSPDRGTYALELVRRNRSLRQAMGIELLEAA